MSSKRNNTDLTGSASSTPSRRRKHEKDEQTETKSKTSKRTQPDDGDGASTGGDEIRESNERKQKNGDNDEGAKQSPMKRRSKRKDANNDGGEKSEATNNENDEGEKSAARKKKSKKDVGTEDKDAKDQKEEEKNTEKTNETEEESDKPRKKSSKESEPVKDTKENKNENTEDEKAIARKKKSKKSVAIEEDKDSKEQKVEESKQEAAEKPNENEDAEKAASPATRKRKSRRDIEKEPKNKDSKEQKAEEEKGDKPNENDENDEDKPRKKKSKKDNNTESTTDQKVEEPKADKDDENDETAKQGGRKKKSNKDPASEVVNGSKDQKSEEQATDKPNENEEAEKPRKKKSKREIAAEVEKDTKDQKDEEKSNENEADKPSTRKKKSKRDVGADVDGQTKQGKEDTGLPKKQSRVEVAGKGSEKNAEACAKGGDSSEESEEVPKKKKKPTATPTKGSKEADDEPVIRQRSNTQIIRKPDEPKDRKSFKSDDYVDDEVASTPADKEHEHKGGLFARLFGKKKDDKNKGGDKKPRERRVYIADNVSELSEEIQKKLKKAKLDEKKLNDNFPILLNVLHFLTKDSFRMRDQPEGPPRDRRPYASPEMMEYAKSLLEVPDNIKKYYRNIEFSGKGGFGRVFAAKDAISKKRVAIKRVPHVTEKDKRNNYCEIGFLASCQHPNVVKFYKAWWVKDEAWIVTEFLEGGTLSEAVKVHQFSERHIAYVAREILKALKYLHSRNFVHRDLKSGNVMMSIEGDIKLIDFGLCCDVSDGPRLQMLGSPFWIPPEMIRKKPHGCPADIWSFAICVLEMYLKEPPYSSSRLLSMFTNCVDGAKQCIPSRASDMAKDFLSRCLEINPKKRATAAELLEHPFVTQPKLEEGIKDVLRGVFVSNSLALSGI